MKRHLPLAATAAAAVLFVASPAIAGADRIRSGGDLVRYSEAFPTKATARVDAVYDAAGDTVVTLRVWGLKPDTEYDVHGHTNACGATGGAAGPHFQHVPDPVQPSTNPVYANPENEVWLDLTTDDEGNGVAQTRVNWQFSPERRARSVIIHAEHPHTGPTDSGVAGAHLACLTVDF